MEEIGHFSTASLITRSTNDVTQIQMLIAIGLQLLVKAPIMAVWAICKIANKQWEWTFSTGVAVIVLLAVVGLCLLLVTPKFKKIQTLTDDLNRVTRENLTGLRVVRAYNAERYQETKFEHANQALTSTNLFAQRTLSFMMPSIQLVMSGLSLAIYWIGAVLINNARIGGKLNLFTDMMVFSQYAIQVVMSFMMLVMIFMLLPRASVSAKRIQAVLDTDPSIIDGTETDSNCNASGTIEFKNVSFHYPDEEECVLKNITFTAKKGETVALIGSTGCGKSTVINLIPRFYDASEGQVLVDGIDVRKYPQKELRNKIGYVSQKATLFTGTIRSNVAYGDNGHPSASQEDVKNAIATAQATDFVENYHKYKNKSFDLDVSHEVRKDNIPLFIQWDKRWGYKTYGSNFLGVNGCGPTSLSMVICGLTGKATWNPYKVAQFSQKQGYYISGQGTSWDLMTAGAKKLGLTSTEGTINNDYIRQNLTSSTPMICSMLPGDFTYSGHFIVLTGIDSEGRVVVNDPNSPKNSEKHWDMDRLLPQIRHIWKFEVEKAA